MKTGLPFCLLEARRALTHCYRIWVNSLLLLSSRIIKLKMSTWAYKWWLITVRSWLHLIIPTTPHLNFIKNTKQEMDGSVSDNWWGSWRGRRSSNIARHPYPFRIYAFSLFSVSPSKLTTRGPTLVKFHPQPLTPRSVVFVAGDRHPPAPKSNTCDEYVFWPVSSSRHLSAVEVRGRDW